MPYRWTGPALTGPESDVEDRSSVQTVLNLWPHRSLPPEGFALFIGVTFLLMLVPLLALLGQAALWGLLPYAFGSLALTWVLLRRSYRDAALREVLTIHGETAHLQRIEPDGRKRDWQANPYWVRVEMQAEGGPVPNYLTLHGGPRVVEIGAFLGPDERAVLKDELVAAFVGAGWPRPAGP